MNRCTANMRVRDGLCAMVNSSTGHCVDMCKRQTERRRLAVPRGAVSGYFKTYINCGVWAIRI